MTLSIRQIRAAANQATPVVARTLTEAKSKNLQTAFLCHSHRDADLVKGMANLLRETGWRVYIDWLDESMPEKPNRETAQKIKNKIVSLEFFIFLATANSMASRWCPWELGYADGKKDIDRILVIPTTDGTKTHGNEYIELYRHIDTSKTGPLAAWRPYETTGVFIKNL